MTIKHENEAMNYYFWIDNGDGEIGMESHPDMVESPPHYTGGEIECIEAIREALGLDGFIAYCRGNIIKYSWRLGMKDCPHQEAGKVAWYANAIREALECEE